MTEPAFQHWVAAAFAAALLHMALLFALPRPGQHEPSDAGEKTGITLELSDPFGSRTTVPETVPAPEPVSAQGRDPDQRVVTRATEPARANAPRPPSIEPAESTSEPLDAVRLPQRDSSARQVTEAVAPDAPSAVPGQAPRQTLTATEAAPDGTLGAATDTATTAPTSVRPPVSRPIAASAAMAEAGADAITATRGDPPASTKAESVDAQPVETLTATGRRPVMAETPLADSATRVTARSLGGDPARRQREQDALRSYLSRLRDHLANFREYPEQSRERREEGTALVTLVVDSRGQLISYHLRRSTGYANLDREAQALIRRASPLPELPGSLGRDRLTLRVPVSFRLEDP
ncbi:TonB family protein [Ectothiorhodospiraceae bacterium WFHF3C12]|nr:TonB family protein [Ectothiorhodospiraceae bacterium WFHF3C12]